MLGNNNVYEFGDYTKYNLKSRAVVFRDIRSGGYFKNTSLVPMSDERFCAKQYTQYFCTIYYLIEMSIDLRLILKAYKF